MRGLAHASFADPCANRLQGCAEPPQVIVLTAITLRAVLVGAPTIVLSTNLNNENDFCISRMQSKGSAIVARDLLVLAAVSLQRNAKEDAHDTSPKEPDRCAHADLDGRRHARSVC